MRGALDLAVHTGRELRDLLSPIDPSVFASSIWDARPLFVPGREEKVEALLGEPFDRAALFAAVTRLAANEAAVAASFVAKRFAADVFRAYFDHEAYLARGEGARPLMAIRPADIEPALASGASVLINGVEHVPRVGALVESIRAALHYVGDVVVGATLSPRGRRVAAHFDPGGAIILQTQGRKRYAFTKEPVIDRPLGKAHLFGDGRFRYTDGREGEPWEHTEPKELFYEEIVMGPGDVLYLPPGVVHHTEAVEGESIALLVTFVPVSFRRIVDRLLDSALTPDPKWRSLPVWVGDNGGRLPPHVEAFAADRLAELRALLGPLSPAGLELGEIWQRSPVSADMWTPARGSGAIEPETRLAVSRRAPLALAVGRSSQGEEGVRIFCGAREIAVDGESAGFFARVLAAGSFVAKDALAWAPSEQRDDWEGVQACLATLLEEGIVERENG